MNFTTTTDVNVFAVLLIGLLFHAGWRLLDLLIDAVVWLASLARGRPVPKAPLVLLALAAFALTAGSARAQAPNDPYFPSQWGLQLIRVPEAWDVTTGSAAVHIAQFDTGVFAHEDLTENVLVEPAPPPFSALGTWHAGVIAADTNNGLGIAGVCQHATLHAYRVIWSEEHLAEAFALAESTPAKIGVTGYALLGWHARREFDAVLDGFSAGGERILICPAGTNFAGGQRLRGPNDARLLVVGACNLDGTRASYSNFGPKVDLWAPGHATTTVEGGYGATDSTAVATAYVAGVAGLVGAANPALTGRGIKDILILTAQPMACGPVVDARAAVDAAGP